MWLHQRLTRIREVIHEIHHVAIATVNADGSPHNSPVFGVFDEELRLYWASSIEAQHSQNIVRAHQVFIVIFDSREGHGGLYISAEARPLENRDETERARHYLSCVKEQIGGTMGKTASYLSPSPQRLYQATPISCWVNRSETDAQGSVVSDRRYEVALHELLKCINGGE